MKSGPGYLLPQPPNQIAAIRLAIEASAGRTVAMHRCFVVLLGALGFVMAAVLPAWAQTDNNDWDDYDTATEKRADALYNADRFLDAEIVYREVLDRHPQSVSALLYHVKGLLALDRYDEALTESRKAVALNDNNGPAHEWLGMSLLLLHHNDEALREFVHSLMLSPSEPTTMIWLAGTYYQKGDLDKADRLFQAQFISEDEKSQAYTASLIGDFFRKIGKGQESIKWWKKSYALGNTDAARYLEWAYSGLTPGFPYDPGESAYWQRRGPNDPYSWFPRLACADPIVAWGLVLIVLATVIILPWLSIGIVALLPARGLINEPTFPWMERARRAWPFMIFLSLGVMLMPMLDWVSAFNIPGSLLPMPKWVFLWIVTLTGIWATNAVAVHWARLYRTDAGTTWENIKDTFVVLLLRGSAVILFIVAGLSLPSEFNWRAALILAAAVLAYFYVQFGGWIRLASLIRLLIPAGPDLVHDAAELARARNLPAPSVWLLRWRKANAFAFPFSNAILVTENLHAILNREEIRAILAHELAHLCEDRRTRAMRLLTPLLLLPMFSVGLWASSYFFLVLGACYLLFLVAALSMRKRARRMEERADAFGKEAESEAGVYPRALAKLYEENLVPAVMPGKRHVHPHLYDRLLAAGITPDYPRPKPPGRWGIAAGVGAIAIHGTCLWALWFCLF